VIYRDAIDVPSNVPIEVLQALLAASGQSRYCAMLLASKLAWDSSQLESNPAIRDYFFFQQSDFISRACQNMPDNWLACRGIMPDRLLLMKGETVIEWFEDERVS